jgi:hypothetical protein
MSDLPKVPFTLPAADVPEGNAFIILGRFQRAALQAGWPAAEVRRVVKEATSKDYDHLRATIAAHCVTVSK